MFTFHGHASIPLHKLTHFKYGEFAKEALFAESTPTNVEFDEDGAPDALHKSTCGGQTIISVLHIQQQRQEMKIINGQKHLVHRSKKAHS